MGDEVKVRIPILESAAVAGATLATGSMRYLVTVEKKMLSDIFGQSVNLDKIRLVSSNLGGRACTLGNVIRVPGGLTLDAPTLVHETTHIWQYQTRGTGYISDSVYHQVVQGTDEAYDVKIVPGQSFYKYPAEKEAMIIQKYFEDSPKGWRTNPDVLRMLGEVRAARPLSQMQIQQETWFGAANAAAMQRDLFSTNSGPDMGKPGTVPLIRIEF